MSHTEVSFNLLPQKSKNIILQKLHNRGHSQLNPFQKELLTFDINTYKLSEILINLDQYIQNTILKQGELLGEPEIIMWNKALQNIGNLKILDLFTENNPVLDYNSDLINQPINHIDSHVVIRRGAHYLVGTR